MATSPNVGKAVGVHISDGKIEFLLFERLTHKSVSKSTF
jgi:hypothetical protein